MHRIPISSEGITQVGYHPDSEKDGTLELEFSTGGVFQFFNVPARTYDELMGAPSKENYYLTNIGKRFPCLRVG
jgi:hypothetical protein